MKERSMFGVYEETERKKDIGFDQIGDVFLINISEVLVFLIRVYCLPYKQKRWSLSTQTQFINETHGSS